jgi:hypothetical protein
LPADSGWPGFIEKNSLVGNNRVQPVPTFIRTMSAGLRPSSSNMGQHRSLNALKETFYPLKGQSRR